MNGQFKYEGKGGEFFSLLLRNILLTVITLGIYGAWAMVDIRKYICDKLTLDGKKFAFTAKGGEVFSLLLVQILLSCITLCIYLPWAIVKIEKYFWSKNRIAIQ